jgi:hypothetical protein
LGIWWFLAPIGGALVLVGALYVPQLVSGGSSIVAGSVGPVGSAERVIREKFRNSVLSVQSLGSAPIEYRRYADEELMEMIDDSEGAEFPQGTKLPAYRVKLFNNFGPRGDAEWFTVWLRPDSSRVYYYRKA